MVTQKQLYSENYHSVALAGIPCNYNQYHTTLRRLNSVCVKLEPASSKNNEILEKNVLQKFTYVHFMFMFMFILGIGCD